MTRVVIFTGSRSLECSSQLRSDILKLEWGTQAAFVGDCPSGLDRYVFGYWSGDEEDPAADLHVCAADWDTHGKAAGPIRNAKMVKAAAALADAIGAQLECHAWPRGESRGTRDCMRKAEAAGAKMFVYEEGS